MTDVIKILIVLICMTNLVQARNVSDHHLAPVSFTKLLAPEDPDYAVWNSIPFQLRISKQLLMRYEDLGFSSVQHLERFIFESVCPHPQEELFLNETGRVFIIELEDIENRLYSSGRETLSLSNTLFDTDNFTPNVKRSLFEMALSEFTRRKYFRAELDFVRKFDAGIEPSEIPPLMREPSWTKKWGEFRNRVNLQEFDNYVQAYHDTANAHFLTAALTQREADLIPVHLIPYRNRSGQDPSDSLAWLEENEFGVTYSMALGALSQRRGTARLLIERLDRIPEVAGIDASLMMYHVSRGLIYTLYPSLRGTVDPGFQAYLLDVWYRKMNEWNQPETETDAQFKRLAEMYNTFMSVLAHHGGLAEEYFKLVTEHPENNADLIHYVFSGDFDNGDSVHPGIITILAEKISSWSVQQVRTQAQMDMMMNFAANPVIDNHLFRPETPSGEPAFYERMLECFSGNELIDLLLECPERSIGSWILFLNQIEKFIRSPDMGGIDLLRIENLMKIFRDRISAAVLDKKYFYTEANLKRVNQCILFMQAWPARDREDLGEISRTIAEHHPSVKPSAVKARETIREWLASFTDRIIFSISFLFDVFFRNPLLNRIVAVPENDISQGLAELERLEKEVTGLEARTARHLKEASIEDLKCLNEMMIQIRIYAERVGIPDTSTRYFSVCESFLRDVRNPVFRSVVRTGLLKYFINLKKNRLLRSYFGFIRQGKTYTAEEIASLPLEDRLKLDLMLGVHPERFRFRAGRTFLHLQCDVRSFARFKSPKVSLARTKNASTAGEYFNNHPVYILGRDFEQLEPIHEKDITDWDLLISQIQKDQPETAYLKKSLSPEIGQRIQDLKPGEEIPGDIRNHILERYNSMRTNLRLIPTLLEHNQAFRNNFLLNMLLVELINENILRPDLTPSAFISGEHDKRIVLCNRICLYLINPAIFGTPVLGNMIMTTIDQPEYVMRHEGLHFEGYQYFESILQKFYPARKNQAPDEAADEEGIVQEMRDNFYYFLHHEMASFSSEYETGGASFAQLRGYIREYKKYFRMSLLSKGVSDERTRKVTAEFDDAEKVIDRCMGLYPRVLELRARILQYQYRDLPEDDRYKLAALWIATFIKQVPFDRISGLMAKLVRDMKNELKNTESRRNPENRGSVSLSA
ncbi:MAG: hypothetical protein JW774_04280 [Candidatus Aureabacteria bacterium]|nr:hypothetical protein [Candidatus Auribacterota bacterium]